MSKELIIYLCGVHSLAFAVFHIFFPKLFKWKEDLKKNSVANRAIIQIANQQLIFIFLFLTYLCFFQTAQLLLSEIGHVVLIGFSGFWALRVIEQFIFLPYNKAILHGLTVAFIMGAVLFALPLFMN
jgi:hypothetical protein